MHQWQIGDVDVIRIEDFDVAMPTDEPLPDWMVPSFGPSVGEALIADSAVAIRDGDTRIVVDPWLLARRSDVDARAASQRLLAQLDDVGFPAGEVDFVVNSHLEGLGWNTVPNDGGWALTFSNATYLYPVEDVTSMDDGEEGADADELRLLASLTDIVAVGDAFPLTAAVSVRRSGGHGRCHQVVRIESRGDVATYLGHLVLHAAQFANPDFSTEDNTAEAALVRRRYLGELADNGGLALTALVGGPGGGRVACYGDGFRILI